MPLFQVIAAKLRSQIAAGTYRPGTRLPSTRRLSAQLAVSLTTINRALRELESERLIVARERSAWTVEVSRPLARVGRPVPPEAPALVGTTGLIHDHLRTVLDPSLVPLGRAEPSADMLPTTELSFCLREILRREGEKSLRYEHPVGSRLLREELARLSISWGCVLEPDDFIITNGCSEAIHLALQVTTRPGDVVAVESPTFYGILQAVAGLGLRVIEIPSRPVSGLDLAILRRALQRHPIRAVLTVPSYNNPVGGCLSTQGRRELAALLAECDVPLIEDDLYGDLFHDGMRLPCVKSHDVGGRILLCGSISKTLAPGYRIGWLVAGRYRDAAQALKLRLSYSTATPLQHAVGLFLKNGDYDRHLRKVRPQYSRRMAQFTELVTEVFPPGIRIHPSRGGYLIWVEWSEGSSAMECYERALALRVSVAPGEIFTVHGRPTTAFRLHAGFPINPEIIRALKVLGECLR